MAMMPVLPSALIEALEAPLPLLAGITLKQQKKLISLLNQRERD